MGAARRVLYAAGFDPPTRAQVDIVRRAAALFDEVIVGVAQEAGVVPLLDPKRRVALLAEELASHPTVRVVRVKGSPGEAAVQHGCQALVARLRDGSELQRLFDRFATLRAAGLPLDLVILMSAPADSYVSSRLVREVARLNGDVAALVPPRVAQALAARRGALDHIQEPP